MTDNVFPGDVTSFNVWDYLISKQEIEQIYAGPGTERGNFLAWVDLKKYARRYATLRDSPVLKWKGIFAFIFLDLKTFYMRSWGDLLLETDFQIVTLV